MNLVFLCQRVPYPPNKGERIRAFHQIRWLAERHDVHVLALAESPAEAAGAEELGRYCSSVEVFHQGRVSSRVRAALAAATGRPLTPAFFYSPSLARRAREIARASPPSAVIACSSSMAQYAPIFGGVPRLLDLVDVDSAKWALFAEDASFPWRFVYRIEANRLRGYEAEQVAAFDRVAVTTGRELEKLKAFSPIDNAFILRQGIDVTAFDGGDREEAPVPTLVFTGQMNYLPNVAAVTHFSRKIFPLLRRRRPTLEFQIVGRQPSAAVQALETIGGIKVTGEVPDVAPFLARAWVFVAPLRVTMGVPTKILEAMAAEVPTVATEAAVRGLADGGVQSGRDLLVAADDVEMTDAIERLLSQRHLRERIGASGRRFVCRSYSWEQTARRLEEALLEIADESRPLRLVRGRERQRLRDLAVMALVFGCLPIIPFRPVLGLAMYAWLAYMRPQDLAWSIKSMQLSMWVAVAMLVGLVLAFGRERFATFRLQTLLLVAIGIWYAITCHTAVLPDLSEKWLDVYLKIILIAVLTTGLVITRKRFDFMMIVIAFSLGLLGFKNGVFAISAGGAQFLNGPGGFMIDRNAFAVALNMAIPLLVGVALTTNRKPIRIAALALVPFCMITIFCTFSRGGLLTLFVVGALLIWRTRKPLLAVAVLALGIGAFAYTASDQLKEKYAERSSSITNYEEDSSAMGRIRSWSVALEMWADHPITGVGPRNFTLLYRRYAETEEVHVAHNSYLQMLAETGLPGFLLFVSLLAVSLVRLQVIRMRDKDGWSGLWATMLQVSLIAFSVGGLLLDMALFDLFYQLVALTVSLEVAAASTVGKLGKPEVVADDAAPWWRQPRAERQTRPVAAGGAR